MYQFLYNPRTQREIGVGIQIISIDVVVLKRKFTRTRNSLNHL
jgi:hypothetical protein